MCFVVGRDLPSTGAAELQLGSEDRWLESMMPNKNRWGSLPQSSLEWSVVVEVSFGLGPAVCPTDLMFNQPPPTRHKL